jgi:hypothetical protein
MFLQIEHIETILMTFKPNNWDAETYSNKLENIF